MLALDGPTLLKRAKRGEVIVLDVRKSDEYAAGHIPFARSLPFAELQRALAKLPKRTPVVAYCRGPYCAVAKQAVELLRREGRDAVRLRAGMAEWIADGMPVEAVAS